jgi:ParB family chromosome partitioning protein
MSERRLGRGLESLLGGGFVEGADTSERVVSEVAIDRIRPNREQPRTVFRDQELGELAESLRSVGVLQPLVVRRVADGYELIAGERRLRAAKLAGLATVPVIERRTSDEDVLTIALIENLQREDLNPIEKARGFKELIDRHGLTQEDAARRLGKDRSSVANFLRLLELAAPVQEMLADGRVTMGHARALASLSDMAAQVKVAQEIAEQGLSVRQIERLVTGMQTAEPRLRRARTIVRKPAHIRDLEDRVRERLGTKVEIAYRSGKGRMIIRFFSDDDFQRVLDALGVSG